MMKKSKGRQKVEMVKMKNEMSLQVTFSKRRSGVFKKASELCTLCDAQIAVIVFSPSQKAFSFGHPNVDSVIDRFLNGNHPPLHQHNGMQPTEIRRNSIIHDLNNHLTEVMNQLESEIKRNEELKKIREDNKKPENWWEEPIEGLDLAQSNQFKCSLENLKKIITDKASKLIQATVHHQNSYVGSSRTFPHGVDGGININSDSDQFNQRRMVNMDAFYNHNMILPNHALPFGNNSHGNVFEGFVPKYNINFRSEYNQNQQPKPEF